MASSTYQTFLMLGTEFSAGGTVVISYSKLVDIKSYPDLGGSPELLETTTLSDPMRTNILGIQGNDSMEFTCNYTSSDYNTVKVLEGTKQHLAVWFGGIDEEGDLDPSATDAKFKFDGYVSVHANGGEVNAVREMTVTVAVSTTITMS